MDGHLGYVTVCGTRSQFDISRRGCAISHGEHLVVDLVPLADLTVITDEVTLAETYLDLKGLPDRKAIQDEVSEEGYHSTLPRHEYRGEYHAEEVFKL